MSVKEKLLLVLRDQLQTQGQIFWRLTFHQTRLPPESSDLSTEPYVLDPYRGSSVDKGTMVEGTYDPSALCFQVWVCLVQGAQCQQNKWAIDPMFSNFPAPIFPCYPGRQRNYNKESYVPTMFRGLRAVYLQRPVGPRALCFPEIMRLLAKSVPSGPCSQSLRVRCALIDPPLAPFYLRLRAHPLKERYMNQPSVKP